MDDNRRYRGTVFRASVSRARVSRARVSRRTVSCAACRLAASAAGAAPGIAVLGGSVSGDGLDSPPHEAAMEPMIVAESRIVMVRMGALQRTPRAGLNPGRTIG